MVPGYSIDLFETFDNMEDITAFTTSGALQDAVWVNMYQNGDQNPALKDVRVRRAIAHAINRAKMIRETLGVALPVPRSWYNERYIPDDVQILAYDPQQARNLLDEANWIDTDGDGIRDDGNGTPLSLRFYTTTDPVRVDFQKYIAADLEQVGIGVEAFPVPSSILFAPFDEDGILMTGNFDLVLFGLTHDMVSPNTGLYWFGCDSIQNPDGGNGYGFCDPRWDELQSKLIPVETDPDVRVELVHEAVRRMDSAVFWIGVYPRTSNYALNTKRWNIDSFQNMGILSGNAFNTVEYWEPN
jgi:ABC-type transport system substrate-binding protein